MPVHPRSADRVTEHSVALEANISGAFLKHPNAMMTLLPIRHPSFFAGSAAVIKQR